MMNEVGTNDVKLLKKEPWETQDELYEDTQEYYPEFKDQMEIELQDLLNEYFNNSSSLDNFYPKLLRYLPLENDFSFFQVEINNSTKVNRGDTNFDNLITNLIEHAHDIDFEDGIENEFSILLYFYIKRYGNLFINKFIPIFLNESANDEILSEALRWIGKVDHPKTYSIRLWLLEHCLFSSSPAIRDGATLGLSSMDDPSAIPFLKTAIKSESVKELLIDLKDVLSDLESEIDALHSKKNPKK